MSSYQFARGSTSSNFNANWDLDLLDKISEHVHGVQMGTYAHAPRAAPTPPPSWDSSLDGGVPVIPAPASSISTYFATFDPSAKIVPEFQHVPVPMVTRPNIGTVYKDRALHARTNVAAASLKKPLKHKRKRTMFSTEQVAILEHVFSTKPYITRDDRNVLVEQLRLSDKSVKVWFQNRRLKGKKQQENGASLSEVDLNRLDYIESKIHERTNESGFVVLDDNILEELAGVIENCLARTPSPDVSEAQYGGVGPIYEPISPASPH